MRLIDADKLKKERHTWDAYEYATEDIEVVFVDDIDRAPTVDPSKELICSVTVNMDTDEVMKRLKERGWEPVVHGRWISCNDRLPEIGDTYIVTGIQKDPHEKEWHYFVDVASNYGDYIDDYWDTFNDWIEGQETHIVAWMPLPEPYKMGGDEE